MTSTDVPTVPETEPALAQEAEATGEYVSAQLGGGQDLRVLPPQLWRPSAFRALRESDYDTWSAKVLHPEDVEAFADADPTMLEITELIERVASQVGASLPNSHGRSRSSRATPKR